jgi:hypothetical protein
MPIITIGAAPDSLDFITIGCSEGSTRSLLLTGGGLSAYEARTTDLPLREVLGRLSYSEDVRRGRYAGHSLRRTVMNGVDATRTGPRERKLLDAFKIAGPETQ